MWKTINLEIIYKNKWWRIRRDKFKTKNNIQGYYEYVDTKGGVIVVPFIDEENVLLIKQYRYPNRKHSLEFPAGGIVRSSSKSAKMELKQETGYSARKINKIGEFLPYTGLSNEICHIYIATGLFKVGTTPEITEEVKNIIIPIRDVKSMLIKNKDGKAITAWIMVQEFLRKNEIK